MDQRTWIEEDMAVMKRGWKIQHRSEEIEYSRFIAEFGNVAILVSGKDVAPCLVSILHNEKRMELKTASFESSLSLVWDLCNREDSALIGYLKPEPPNHSFNGDVAKATHR
jgi:hypothetical protein